MDLSILKADIIDGPLSSLCLPLVQTGQDQAVADLFNSLVGIGTGVVMLTTRFRQDVIHSMTAAALRVALGISTSNTSLATDIVTKWDTVISMAKSADPGSQIDLTLIGPGSTLGDPVADGVMTSAEFTALTTRIGSRAEVLYGVGTIINATDCGNAR